jgi:hypothetical protein
MGGEYWNTISCGLLMMMMRRTNNNLRKYDFRLRPEPFTFKIYQL